MNLKKLIYAVVMIVVLSAFGSCQRHTCPTYATSGPTKHKKTRHKKKNAPWHKSNKIKHGKDVGGVAPQ